MRVLLALLVALLLAGNTFAQAAQPLTLTHAEAVRGDWHDTAPPVDGWVPVTLMELWTPRWPDHDGVVWYRLRWQQADADAPVGLMLDYICMAGAVYVNGSLVGRDRSLVEPLSRSWITPQYYLLDAPLLQQGENELLVRVSGLTAYQPGLGTVTVGDPVQVEAKYRANKRARFDLQMLDTAIGAVLAALFGLFWLLRRQDTTYGWYAAGGLFGMLYGLNWVNTSPWPFATTDGWQAFNGACYLALVACYAVFLLRFADRRWPRSERTLLALAALVFVLALLLPQVAGPHRNVWILPAMAFNYVCGFTFMVWALRHGRADQKVLGLCYAIPLLLAVHDAGVYLGLIRADSYLMSFASPLMLLGMGFVLAHRFTATMKRVEGFNIELKQEVQAATTQLADTLNQQHALELAHSRAGERLQLVRDLHDGFGGTLVGAIARLEQTPGDAPKEQLIDLLKEMRDDLRLVIDTTAQEQADLAQLIAPLRHRASRLLDAADIDARWQVDGLDDVHLEPARSLDLLRLLQEALTNVFKHSHARRVDVRIAREGGRLHVQVQDDGVGLADAGNVVRLDGGGAGFASMRLRARRLGGDLRIEATSPGTCLLLDMPLVA
ncbi:MAG: 7TM diverse intracellular signaling domain-containing protein [Thermomonas sp.]|uniref:sensor histidine kinase n=1 Tax=Thermomonas sp. TaxID=1971895 RepID=UPI0039E3091D